MKYFKTALLFSMLMPASVFAQTAQTTSSAAHPVVIVMLSIIALLAFVILLMGNVMVSSHAIFKKRNQKKTAVAPVIVAALSLLATPAFAQEAVAVSAEWVAGLSNTNLIILVSIIALELIIIFYMVSVFRSFTRLKKSISPQAEKKDKWAWLERLNRTRTVDAKSEEEFNLGHEYDGIEELDNPTPPWWNWGFILSVVFGVVYLWVYFISYSAPNQYQELEIANAKAEERIKNYMAQSAENIDENNVTLLTASVDLTEGQKMYIANCAACHREDGGGSVGPNLTDEYWKHGGSINDIFRTVKYGVPEKGMKSWREDFTPKQIAQISSFVHSLTGSNPPNPKEPEGDLYTEAVQDVDTNAEAASEGQ